MILSAAGNSFPVLSIPEWRLEAGRQVALSGPSGCGKTTFLHILAGLLSPTGGSVEICGRRLDQMTEAELDSFRAGHIGYIFQSLNLLQGFTALENVLLGISFSGKKVDKEAAKLLLERVGLADRMRHCPAQLSMGQQQRVAVARSLVNKPALILADEPTGSLDPVNSSAVIDLIREVCSEEKCSLVLVSHEQDVVARFEEAVPFLELNIAFAGAPR
ncbi:MAG: ABC transporter ATP-binding protein [Candidatus Abyssobacteria bacterium SURF_5]|uniref:ABC transporter ATP-binding protein n=1 Tax=Abyssobacteria bacterium (strain SURF_5) TaxID=2093360 RepID=A0A3A4NUA8_ABYX5|nr:MAG: ABC transporter ATP-binding protein [Candidatus Abyssubacteria bacterium SURF_5]